jgi:sporulation protein YlmC with PRC-barrel domain
MLFTQALGLPVITADDATSLGKVADLTIGAHGAAIAALQLSGASGHTEALAWSAVESVGKDAVIARSPAVKDLGQGTIPAHHHALGRRVLTEHGVEHGTVKDISFDPATGRILTLYTALGEISGTRLLGLGSYAVVVRTGPA